MLGGMPHAYGQSTRTAYGQPGVIGADGIAHGIVRVVKTTDEIRIFGHDGAQPKIGMAAHILGARYHRNVGSSEERRVEHEIIRTCRSLCSRYHIQKKKNK